MTRSLMKWFALIAIALTSPAFAGPFVISAPTTDTTVSQCGVYLDAAAKVVIPLTAITGGAACKFDISSIAPGAHTVQMSFMTPNDPIWGALEGAKSSPLAFTRPTPPSTAPGGLGLIP